MGGGQQAPHGGFAYLVNNLRTFRLLCCLRLHLTHRNCVLGAIYCQPPPENIAHDRQPSSLGLRARGAAMPHQGAPGSLPVSCCAAATPHWAPAQPAVSWWHRPFLASFGGGMSAAQQYSQAVYTVKHLHWQGLLPARTAAAEAVCRPTGGRVAAVPQACGGSGGRRQGGPGGRAGGLHEAASRD